jgi:DNA (cytosine-5)-methyltransferase 1
MASYALRAGSQYENEFFELEKAVHPALARLGDPIVHPDLFDAGRAGAIDLYDVEGGGYELKEDEIVIDLFCGAGGTSEGIRQALGESPMFALNHNPVAIGVHDANHPETIHLESDVFAMDPADHIPAGKRVGLISASPACTHFSGARGGKPVDREIRDHAWVLCQWAEHPVDAYRPRVITIENVREFLTWCPVDERGKIMKSYIDKNGLGSIFKEWRARLVAAGYQVEYKILNAADYGAATKRKRLFVVARRDGLPIRFPKPTHAPRNSDAVKQGLLKPYASAASAIEFGVKGNPLFMYPADAKKAGAVRPLADNTLRRVAAGVERYVIEADEPYMVPYTAATAGGINLGSREGHAIFNPVVSPLTHAGQPRFYAMNDQLPTITGAHRGELALYAPVCAIQPLSAAIIPLRRDCAPVGLAEPMPTLATHSQMAIAVASFSAPAQSKAPTEISPFIVGAGGGEYAGKPRRVDDALNTITCHSRQALIVPSLIRVNHGDVDKNGKRRGQANHDLLEPLPTQSTSNEFAVIAPVIQIQPRSIQAAMMVTTGYGERVGQAPRCLDIAEPVGTLVASGGKHAVVQASMIAAAGLNSAKPQIAYHMAQQNADNVGHSVRDPISTMTTAVSHQNVVASHIMTLRQNTVGQSMNEPLATLCAAGGHHAECRTSMVKYYTPAANDGSDEASPVPIDELGLTEEQRFDAWWIARFLEVYGTKSTPRPEVAHLYGPRPSVVGRPGAILYCVEMRMLLPREAFLASSFPEDYEFERTSSGKTVTRSQALALVGNAVPPLMAKALVGANCKPRISAGPAALKSAA